VAFLMADRRAVSAGLVGGLELINDELGTLPLGTARRGSTARLRFKTSRFLAELMIIVR
jgi:hypothetical protein